jgi:hypothetical protein
MLEKTLLEYARKYGYIRHGEPTKMRSRKDEAKKKSKQSPTTGDEDESDDGEDLSDDEELAILSRESDEAFEFEVEDTADDEEDQEEFDLS